MKVFLKEILFLFAESLVVRFEFYMKKTCSKFPELESGLGEISVSVDSCEKIMNWNKHVYTQHIALKL